MTTAIRFAAPELPLVSVVIPVYNHWRLTRRCLESIATHSPLELLEVVVVDDGSSDQTPRELARIPGLRVVSNPANLGFLDTVNRGAAVARGEHLVLLNNDTVVTPGWLEALLDALEPDVGAVGSRLDYPDGTLQEAGGAIWSDGTGSNYGRGLDPALPEFGFRREVDYCSAAALLVRRHLFEELGGFDRRFAPGYYEDTDLCFALRERGWRVMYEPRSVVIHDEGASFGSDMLATIGTNRGKVSQFVNRFAFCVKWADELSRHWPRQTAAGLLGGRIDIRPRVLVVDHMVPTWDQDSGSLRMLWILRLLRELGCQVTFFAWNRLAEQPYTGELQRRGIEVHHGPMQFSDFAAARAALYDLVILSRPSVAPYAIGAVRERLPSALVVYDTVDLNFLRETRRAHIEGRAPGPELEAQRADEVSAIRSCDITAAVTETEARLVESDVPGTRTVVLPNVHQVPATQPAPFAERSGLLFIGGFRHLPNVDAMLWFCEEVLPLVRRELAEVRLEIVGSLAPPEVLALESEAVHVAGYVPDADPCFRRARVFVSPLRYGAGMKGKIGHALALGLPVVTTSIGAEGMHLEDGRHVLVRDDAAGFAEAVVTLYRDAAAWSRLAAEGRTLIEERFTPAAMRRRLRGLLGELTIVRDVRAAGREPLHAG